MSTLIPAGLRRIESCSGVKLRSKAEASARMRGDCNPAGIQEDATFSNEAVALVVPPDESAGVGIEPIGFRRHRL
jgi:hypothetical protein